MSKEALKLALEALEDIGDEWGFTSQRTVPKRKEAITAIKAALEAKDEPVAIVAEIHMSRYTIEWINGDLPEGTNLYTTPPQRTWVGLTRMELIKCGVLPFGMSYELYEAIEQALKERNT